MVINATPTTPACGETTFTLNGELTFDAGVGDLVITDQSGRKQTILNGDWTSPQTFQINDIPADGILHSITVEFTGDPCSPITSSYNAPHSSVINSMTQAFKPEYVPGEAQYHVTLTINYSNALGTNIKIKDGETVINSQPMNFDAGITDIQLDFDLGSNHDLKVYFEDREECAETLNVNSEKMTICPGTSIDDWYGQTLTPTETDKVFTHEESYMLAILIVDFYPTYKDMPAEDKTIIEGETYTWNGEVYETAGVYTKPLQTVHGCDSIVTLNLTVQENIVENVAFDIAEQCAGEGALEIVIQHTGHLTDARLTFSDAAIQAGFVNETYPIENDTVNVPYNARAGIFSVNIDLLFHDRLKHSANVPFTLLFPSSVLEQGWMDAIFVLTHDYNGGYDFTDFQWYKKGQMLVGETGPYLYQPLEVGAEYSAMLTEVSGLQMMTCPIIITDHTDISVYPTVVSRRGMLHVSVTEDARLTLYSPTGNRISTFSIIHGGTQIAVPATQGIYLAEVVLESGQRKVIKFMVR